jgi:hypothetical protein
MNIKTKYLFLFVSLAMILTACGAPASTAADPVTITQSFWDAIIAKDTDAAMAFVADDVVIRGGPGDYDNKADFKAHMSSDLTLAQTYEVSDLKLTSEDTVTCLIKVTHDGYLVVTGPAKLQVKDGKIVYIEFL